MSAHKPAETQSLTGSTGVRYPLLDLARGFMLLLIAWANISYWTPVMGRGDWTWVDQWVVLVRTALVDQRAYPLFAILLGIGLVLSARGLIARARREGAGLTEAQDIAARTLRWRGVWLTVFGLAHGLVFGGDILGAYGLITLMLAGPIVHRSRGVLVFGALGVALVHVSVLLLAGTVSPTGGGPGVGWSPYAEGSIVMAWAQNAGYWAMNTPLTVLTSLSLPAVALGALLARHTAVTRPEQHRGALTVLAVAGLTLGVVGSLPLGLALSNLVPVIPAFWALSLHSLTGVAAAIGWLSLIGLVVSVPVLRDSDTLGTLRVTGQSSLSAYVAQTLGFTLVLGLAQLYGLWDGILPAQAAALATVVWLMTVVSMVLLSRRGRRGVLEAPLRKLVSQSVARREGKK